MLDRRASPKGEAPRFNEHPEDSGLTQYVTLAAIGFILAGVFSTFGYSVETPLEVRVIWLVWALSGLIGLVVFIPYKLGDTKEETKNLMARNALN